MKNIIIYLGIALLIGVLHSCKKADTPVGTASITVVNAVAGSTTLALDLNSRDAAQANAAPATISYSAFMEFGNYSGTQTFNLYKFDNSKNVSLYPALLNLTIDLPVSSVNSLFLAGTIDKPDTLLVRDTPIYFQAADSSMSVRFVNLSPGSSPISINRIGGVNGSEITSLSYKGITRFKKYPANASISSYTFEFRDAVSGRLLASIRMDGINEPGTSYYGNTRRYKNFTIVFNGLPDPGKGVPQRAFIVNN